MAESDKERFVKYYFRGMKEEPVDGEEDVIIPSPKIATYDKKPEMSLAKLVPEFNKRILTRKYHFAVMNFANPDMVAHTGNIKATVKAIEYVDRWVGEVVKAVLSVDGTVLITGDHGNAEELLTYPTKSYFFTTDKGVVNTDHSNNPVPLFVIDKRYEGRPIKLPQKALSDIAPTVLDFMGLPKSQGMTGESLLAYIK
jgi:2,3-bisphosphoglycerate-independent phosphoglycerate mutase